MLRAGAAWTFVPPPPFLHMFTHTLLAFRRLGLTAEEEDTIMVRNAQRAAAWPVVSALRMGRAAQVRGREVRGPT